MNTLKKLRRRWTETPTPVDSQPKRMPLLRPPGPKEKPPQATILRSTTARRLNYLIDHTLMQPVVMTPLDDCYGMPRAGLVVARRLFRKRDPISGVVTTEKIDDDSPTCGV